MALTRRAVRQAGVHHRRRFIDAPADLRHDAVDDLQQVVVVAELDVALFHLAAAFDVNLLRPVDEDVADRRVLEQHLQRAEAERLVEHFVDEPLALHAVEQRIFRVAQALDDQADFAAERVALQVAHARQVELIDQLAVDEPFEFFKALGALARRRPAGCRCPCGWSSRRAAVHARSDRVAVVTWCVSSGCLVGVAAQLLLGRTVALTLQLLTMFVQRRENMPPIRLAFSP